MPKRKPTGIEPSSEEIKNVESKHDGPVAANTNSSFKNKERVLIVSSRGITFRCAMYSVLYTFALFIFEINFTYKI